MTNTEYIAALNDGYDILDDMVTEAEGNEGSPPTGDQVLMQRFRDWVDSILGEN